MTDKQGGCNASHLKFKWTRQSSFVGIGQGPLTGELRTYKGDERFWRVFARRQTESK
jgi:hypothetical protein